MSPQFAAHKSKSDTSKRESSDSGRSSSPNFDGQAVPANYIEFLQRTVGNRSTQRILAGQTAPLISKRVARAPLRIQRSIFTDAAPALNDKYPHLTYKFPINADVEPAETFWNQHIKLPPAVLVTQMLYGMEALLQNEPLDVDIQLVGRDGLRVLVQTQPKPQVGNQPIQGLNRRLVINRYFTFKDEKLAVKEDRTDVEQGLGKQLYRNLLPIYDHLRLEEITLDATDTGKYAWARYGFLPTSPDQWQKITSSILTGDYGVRRGLETSLTEELKGKMKDESIVGNLKTDISHVLASVLTPQNLEHIAEDSEEEPNAAFDLDKVFTNLLMKLVDSCLEAYFDDHFESLNKAFESKGGFGAVYGSAEKNIKQKVLDAVDWTGLRQAVLLPAKEREADPVSGIMTVGDEVFNSLDPDSKKYIGPDRVIKRELAQEVQYLMTRHEPDTLRHLIGVATRGPIEQKLIYLLLQRSDVWEGRLQLSGADRSWIEGYINQVK